jgi:hypothetical protein
MEEKFKIITNVKIEVIDVDTNELLQTIEKHNLVTTLGKNLVRDMLGMASGITGLNYIAMGTDDTVAAITDTVLGAEEHRDVFTDTLYDTAKVTFKYYLDSSTANGVTLVEAGLFGDNATASADSGTLFARVVHTDIVKTSSVAVTYSWDITIS